MENEITKNLVFLADQLTNLERILLHLEEKGIISTNERHKVLLNGTPFERNTRFLDMIKRKDWNTNKNLVLEIMRETNNEYCADKIEGKTKQTKTDLIQKKILKSKWWPDKKLLIKSLYRRKIGDKLLVEDLHEKFSQDENQMVVICESEDALKLTGLGGVGKTLTATWYADEYEDQYTHVLWIDCGEGSLLNSFKKLARDLDVKHFDKLLDLDDYARKSYEALEQCKCLWIYDNAENCQGSEGIHKILPIKKKNFSCLVTSISKEWRTENGFGEISRFELNIFEENESLEFLHANLKFGYSEGELRTLCSTLGNLPLALQLAVSALNAGKIDIQNYTQRNQFKNIIDAKFDDYERTINGNIQISLELILKEDNGMRAKELFLIFGYIRPDEIKIEFFQQILKLDDDDMREVIELLTKYSLITQNEVTVYPSITQIIYGKETDSDVFSDVGDNESCSNYDSSDSDRLERGDICAGKANPIRESRKIVYLNIHRLLQQVIRHNGKKTEKETLRKILSVDRFLEYKLVPFLQYADENLKNEFQQVKAQLLDQRQLVKLLKEGRTVESVHLGEFIDKEINKNTTKFNYALCLEKNGNLEDLRRVLEEIHAEEINEDKVYCSKCVKKGLLKLKAKVTKSLVEGQLLITHWKMGNIRKVQEILEERKHFTVIESQVSLEAALNILKSNLINSNYAFCYERYSTMGLKLDTETKKIALHNCLINYDILLPEELQELSITGEPQLGQGHLDLRHWIPKNLIRLITIKCYSKDTMTYIPNAERLKSEKERLKSFTVGPWPHSFLQAKDLAKAGLFFLQQYGDKLACAFCGGTLCNWKKNDVPMEEHRRNFPKCPFICNSPVGNIPIEQEINARGIIVSMDSLNSIEYLDLSHCSLSVDSANIISPKELRLEDVLFIRNDQEVQQVSVNEFVNFQQINEMQVYASLCHSVNMSIDMSSILKIQYLYLSGVTVLNWEEAKWNVQKLKLEHISFLEKTKMEIEEMEIHDSSLDLSILPSTIQKLSFRLAEIVVSEKITLPFLKYLELNGMSSYCLTHFQSLPLTHIHFICMLENVDVNLLPESVTSIKISRHAQITGGIKQLEKLILNSLSNSNEKKVLRHLQTNQLVLYNRIYAHEPTEVLRFIQMGIKTIAVRVHWGQKNFETSSLSKYVDRKSKYYLLKMGIGTSIEKNDFHKLMEFV